MIKVAKAFTQTVLWRCMEVYNMCIDSSSSTVNSLVKVSIYIYIYIQAQKTETGATKKRERRPIFSWRCVHHRKNRKFFAQSNVFFNFDCRSSPKNECVLFLSLKNLKGVNLRDFCS